jgi:hypothetical protein
MEGATPHRMYMMEDLKLGMHVFSHIVSMRHVV